MLLNKNISIAIDGPAAAGKSTVAKRVAEKLDFVYIDTGAMYRALTLEALKKSVDVRNEQALIHLLTKTVIELKQSHSGQLVFINGEDVTLDIRSEQVTKNVSILATHPRIRKSMVKKQQQLANKQSVVMDGRDIGTHVLTDADLKFFLIATVEERAKRRHEENLQNGFTSNLTKLRREIELRDAQDTKREVSPLIKAKDAIEIDTTSLSIENVMDKILSYTTEIISNNT